VDHRVGQRLGGFERDIAMNWETVVS
jgi:hypothetical protein